MANEQKQEQVPYWEKHGIPRISLKQAGQVLDMMIRTGQTRGVMCLIGDAGVGKTQLVEGVARRNGYRLQTMNLAQFGLLSGGVPQKAEDEHFRIAVPETFPNKSQGKTLLFLDEVNQGTDAAIKMFFQLVEGRRLYNYELPEETIIVAAMNPATKNYSVSRVETDVAMNRRLSKYFVYSTHDAFLEHAATEHFSKSKPAHSLVQRFIKHSPVSLLDEKARDLGKQFPCPATWQTVSDRLFMLEKEGVELGSSLAATIIGGIIGTTMAKLLAEYAHTDTLLSSDDILFSYPEHRETVQRAVEKGHQQISDLFENLPRVLLATKPETSAVARNLAQFLSDIPRAKTQAIYTSLAAHAGEIEGGMTYLNKLALELSKDPQFAQLSSSLREIDAMIKGERTRDPMA
jgi:hypothetical protein